MKRIALLALVAVAGMASADSVLYYGGDYQGDSNTTQAGFPIADQKGGADVNTVVYDDFTLTQASTITALYGNYMDSGNARASSMGWEIRTGVQEGSGGTLVASGSGSVTSTAATGRSSAGLPEFTYTLGGLSQSLSAGTYFLGLWINGTGSNAYYMSSTLGTNHVGSPAIKNGNSFLNSDPADFGFSWASVGNDVVGDNGKYDFSFGVMGNANTVPEPATWAVLGLGVVALARRRRK